MSIVLRGLDASNPLGFLASLGLLRVLDSRWRDGEGERPHLSFVDEGLWHPRLTPVADLDEIADAVLRDLVTWEDEPALALAYTKDGKRTVPGEKGAVEDLKPPPGIMREFLDEMAERAAGGIRRSAETAAAYGTDVALDRKGMTKPTALHFTAGQQTFLRMVRELRTGLQRGHVTEALQGPWRSESRLPSLSWDSTTARVYALRATDPSGEKRGCVPGAEWLAFLGLSFLPVFPRGPTNPLTTCVEGGWKDGVFTWPIWDAPATAPVVKALLGRGPGRKTAPEERSAMGISIVFQAGIGRRDQGGYGFFSPARVV